MITTMPDPEFYSMFRDYIPKGIYYEAAKHRWRVRLYKEGVVVYRRYFPTFNAAFTAFKNAKDEQAEAVAPRIENMDISTRSTADLINSITLI